MVGQSNDFCWILDSHWIVQLDSGYWMVQLQLEICLTKSEVISKNKPYSYHKKILGGHSAKVEPSEITMSLATAFLSFTSWVGGIQYLLIVKPITDLVGQQHINRAYVLNGSIRYLAGYFSQILDIRLYTGTSRMSGLSLVAPVMQGSDSYHFSKVI